MSAPVLIVGAGPVGLTAALVLAEMGVACRLIDRLPHRINQSRAAIIHARTSELLERLGVINGFLDAAVKVRGVHVMDGDGKTLLRPNLHGLPTEYDFFLGLGQDETERILTEALAGLGIAVERPVTLTGFTQTSGGVTAALTHADGKEEQFTADYLIGCDGSKSAVRHQLGLPLEGETLDVYWATADVKLDWPFPPDEAVAIPTPEGFGFASPLPHGRWRVVVDMGPKPDVLPTEIPLEDVQRACDRVGLRATLSDPVWISPFGVNTRMVPTMQVGRVFLAGDASHVHSPVGGQGMNTGIQDAINLAWKLALAVKGQGTPALLDSYNAERHANAKRLLGFVGPATKMVNLRNPIAVRLRAAAMAIAGQLGLTAIAARRASELDIHYRHSPAVGEYHPGTGDWLRACVRHEPHPSLMDCWNFGRGPRAGERAPDAHGLTDGAGEPFRLFADWIGDLRHQLLVFTGLHPKPERVAELSALAANAEKAADGLIRSRLIRPADVDAAGGLIDADGDAYHLYGARYECLYLIRPDGYVAFRSQPAEWEPLAAFLGKTFAMGAAKAL